ncbi:MAG: SlyX family protein [Thiobacillaceae bacterium]|jgi:SlyX protein|nr:SlyX family protein [Thiobacillaceae bacterium]
MESRLTEIEIKLSYAEDLLDELNRTVFRQQEQIDRLRGQVALLQRQLEDLAPPERRELREEIPPHY